MDLENKINIIRMRIINFRHKYKHIFDIKSEAEKAIFVFDSGDPHFVKSY